MSAPLIGRRNITLATLGLLALISLGISVQAAAQDAHGTLRPITVDGLGNPNNYGFHRLYQFQGYLWTTAGNRAQGGIIYRSRDGENWEAVSPPGIDGDLANDSIVSLAWFKGENDPPSSKGKLYAATYSFRALAGNNQNGGDLWRANADAKNPAKIVWENITKDAFGDSRIQAFVGFVVLKDYLYVGTFSSTGSEIFRTKTGAPADWHHVSPKGMDDPACNTDFHLNIVFGEHAYFGSEEASCLFVKGGEIWRTDGNLIDGQLTLDGWEKVTAAPGFGNAWNNNIFGMDIFQGHFYGATWTWRAPGAEVFRAPVIPPHEGVTPVPFQFEQVNVSGWGNPQHNLNNGMVHLGDTLYVAGIDFISPLPRGRGYFIRTSGAPATGTAAEHLTTWTEITAPDFPPTVGPGFFPGDGPYWLEVFKNKIYVAVEQGGKGADGRGQLWVYEPTNVPHLRVTHVTDRVRQGGRITLRGTGFDDYQGKAYATLDGSPLPVVKWTDTKIVARIPVETRKGKRRVTVYRDGMTVNGGFTKVEDEHHKDKD